jgi:6-pyruvoyltetrahydropterin/6-carboxytetrahydropterin synthase
MGLVTRKGDGSMSESYHVRLDKEFHVFSAAHFITYAGHVCERLHGHNYRVFAEVFGPLDENQYVVDFIALRDTLKEITDQLDHHVLLPTTHPAIHVEAGEREVEVTFEERRWVFPRGDCVLLPVANTTAELLSRYLGKRLLDALHEKTGFRPTLLRVGVDENNGQWGICELRGDAT